MAGYKYILLDWDGNLAKTLDLWLQAFRTVLSEEGFNPTDEQIAASFGKTEAFFAELGIKEPSNMYARADVIGKAALPLVELYPDALEVLNALRNLEKKTALITSSNRENIQHLLEKYEMHALFDVVVAREDTVEQKPSPEPLFKALELLQGTATDAIMIGDSDKDLGAAQAAGIDSILFYPDEHAKFYNLETLKEYNPTFVVRDFRDIINLV